MFVQEAIRDLHKKKISALFIKLDISKAFDTVNWPYLLEIMAHLGFGQKMKELDLFALVHSFFSSSA
jgi:hypothetical protein